MSADRIGHVYVVTKEPSKETEAGPHRAGNAWPVDEKTKHLTMRSVCSNN